MKFIYVIATFLIVSQTMLAQIGINTENLLSGTTFQVDPLNNSTTSGVGLEDDMIVTHDDNGVMLGLGAKASKDAQLSLNSKNKSLKMNEVALKSLTDIVTVPNPRAGMIVYNTTSDPVEEVEIGWCYFDGVKWNRILESKRAPGLKNEFTTLYQLPADLEIPSTSYARAIAGVYSDARKILFTNEYPRNEIVAPSAGAYVFAIRLYTYSPEYTTTTWPILYDHQEVLYMFLVSKTKNKLLEKAIITFPYTIQQRSYYSYRLVMGTTLDKDEIVEVYIARGTSPDFVDLPLNIRAMDSSTDPNIKSAARTSLVFWKL